MTVASAHPSGTQAVDRAARLLTLVVEGNGTMTLAALAERTGYAKSTASRLLSCLERNRLVARTVEGTYEAGQLFARYAVRSTPEDELVRLAHPVLERLAELTGESAHLAIVRDDAVMHVDEVESTFLLGSRSWLGVDVPPHTSALGKVLYAHRVLPIRRGPLERPTNRSIATLPRLKNDLDQVRRNGFAVTVDELEIGLTGLASPVVVGGEVVAAIGISGATARVAPELQRVARLVIGQARTLSAQLSSSQASA